MAGTDHMGRPTDDRQDPGTVLGVDLVDEELRAPDVSRQTHAIPIPGRRVDVAPPTPASDDLARVPLPEGWEAYLDVSAGPALGQGFRIERPRVIIGRGQVDVSIPDRKISRRHASLEVYGAACVLLKDLGSTNGTWVNGERVHTAELQDGDEIRIGETVLSVTIGPAVPAGRSRG